MILEELTSKVEELEALQTTGLYYQVEINARELLKVLEVGEDLDGIDTSRLQEIEARTLLALSQSLGRRGMVNDALPYAEQALYLTGTEAKELQAKAYGTIGNVYSELSDYPKALENFRIALGIFEELGMKGSIASIMSYIGGVHNDLSDYSRALEYYRKSLSLYEELGDKRGMATGIASIGVVYMYLSDNTRAIEYYQKALAINEELGNLSNMAVTIGNIGAAYHNTANYTLALEYLMKALSLNKQLNKEGSIGINFTNIGMTYFTTSSYDLALEYFQKALAISKESGNQRRLAINLGHVGMVYGTQEFEGYDITKSEEYLLQSLAICKEIKLLKQQYETFKLLAELYEKVGRTTEAFAYFKQYHNLEKEVRSEEVRRQAEQFDYERKNADRERQVALLKEREDILNNILPEEITTRLIKGENPIADHFDSVSILFMDIVRFTELSVKISAQQLVYLLNTIFTAADGVIREFGLEKIKTIGDAYMAVAGVPIVQENHAERAANAALKLIDVMQNLEVQFPEEYGDRSWIESIPNLEVRIGVHCGFAAAGVVGDNKFVYDLWGDAVNTAARMESHGEAGKVHVSEEFVRYLTQTLSKQEGLDTDGAYLLEKIGVKFVERGEIVVKGKGIMRTYFLVRK